MGSQPISIQLGKILQEIVAGKLAVIGGNLAFGKG